MKINDSAGKEMPAVISIDQQPAQTAHREGTADRAAKSPMSHSRPAHLTTSVSSGRAVNSSRIAEIRQKIADGSYQIDAARIADSLLNAAREFLLRRRN
jgi:flagellar biosynthesis anti-sigma factor FlgM